MLRIERKNNISYKTILNLILKFKVNVDENGNKNYALNSSNNTL